MALPSVPTQCHGAARQYSHPLVLLMENLIPASLGSIRGMQVVTDPFCSQHSAQVGSAGRLGAWSFKLPLKGEISREGLRRIDDQAYVAAPFPFSTHRDKSLCIALVAIWFV